MQMRTGVMVALAFVLAMSAQAGFAGQTPPATPTRPATKPASTATANLKMVELMPLTCAQAWAVSGKDYSELYRMVAALATVSLANRDLAFPNTKEAGMDAGIGIAKDCKADPQGLLFGIVDKHVRRLATPRVQ